MNLREAAQQALEALEGVVSAHAYESGTPVEAIAALREALNTQQTHSEECWRWHHECAIRKIEELSTSSCAKQNTEES
jgi:hypothetical protein